MNGRRYLGQQEASQRKPLTEEQKAKQRAMASCKMIIEFHNSKRPFLKWSNEWQQKKIHNISDALNELFRIFDKDFRSSTFRAAIFDTRVHKDHGAHNKIYQYENGSWKLEKPITW